MGTLLAHAQKDPPFDLQGHRGARGLFPENTIPAFLEALNQGVTTLELDVVITADSQMVVSHEPWMSATICLDSAGQPIPASKEKQYNIYKMTYDQVRQFDCGTREHPEFPAQQHLHTSKPLLVDVIRSVERHIRSYTRYEVDYNIEIKASPDGDNKFHPDPGRYSDLVFRVLNDYVPLKRVVIQSFDPRVLRYWHEKYPAVRLSLLVDNLRSPDANFNTLGFTPQIYSPHYRLLTKARVDQLRRQGIRVIPYTVNEIDDMKRLKEWGVSGIITDYPDRAAAIGLARTPNPPINR